MESFEWKGLWWLPESEHQVAGILTFSPTDGIKLELIGALGPQIRSSRQNVNHNVIHGVVEKGNLVTLAGCYLTRSKNSISSNFSLQYYNVPVAYVGAHFSDPETETFYRADVKLTYIGDWVGISGFNIISWNADAEKKAVYEVKYSLPDKIEASTDEANISITFSMSADNDRLEKLNISQETVFSLRLDNQMNFERVLDEYIAPLQNLVTLAVDRPSSILSVRLCSESTKVKTPKNEHDGFVDVYFEQRSFRPAEKRLPYLDDLIFGAGEIKPIFKEVLTNWLSLSAKLKRICDLLFDVSYNRHLSIEHVFLNVAVALESFHRDALSQPGEQKFVERVGYL